MVFNMLPVSNPARVHVYKIGARVIADSTELQISGACMELFEFQAPESYIYGLAEQVLTLACDARALAAEHLVGLGRAIS